MFDNERYITKGVNETISIQLGLLLWSLIDELKKKEKFTIDYLQVFELRSIKSNNGFNQELIHKQEVEPYKKVYLFSASEPIDAKIYAIDDSEHSVMMLSSEY
ncbi:DUF960 domain-containing protein [Clostridium swellfunianum]|uniref:DUF960 family protein n=1 Tax=Clostridium swellfunianum TaxID=1367462 RepID=UPI00202F2F8D|nr:DUF960 family protein [Clostridium swellfunianum]MCM0648427.1 DUF960 domain-containing protein [Clostridium swellfunianum]